MTTNALEATMWEFPILENIEDNLIDSYQLPDRQTSSTPSHNNAQSVDTKRVMQISEEELNKLNQLKIEYETKVKLINSIFLKISDLGNRFDNEVIELLDDIIRSAVKKIILKEINLDKGILSTMIEDLKSMLDHDQEYLTIHVSPTDYNTLIDRENTNIKSLKEDTSLNTGDVIIKSKYGEVKALIDGRINELFRIDNDK